MIRVNLLPVEYRKTESSSLSLFLLFMVGVVFVALSFVAWLAISLQGSKIKTELGGLEKQLESLKKRARYVAQLENELKQYGKRLATVMAIRAGRIYWSKKLHLVVKDTSRGTWFVRMRMQQRDPIRLRGTAQIPAGQDGGFLELHCFQKTDDYKKLGDYRRTLMRDRVFFADFNKIAAPEFTIAEWKKAVEEDQITLSFKVILYLKPQAIYLE